MQSSNDQSRPRRTCASASFRLVGDFVRIVAAVAAAHSPASASSARQNILHAVACEQPVDRAALRRHRPLPGRFGEGRERGVDRDIAAQRIGQIGETVRAHVMRRDAGRDRVGGLQPVAGERHTRCRARPACAAETRWRRRRERNRCRPPASRTESGRPRRDASRAPTRRRRRPSRCRRSARHRASDSA